MFHLTQTFQSQEYYLRIVKMGSGEAAHPKEPWLPLQRTWIQFPAPI